MAAQIEQALPEGLEKQKETKVMDFTFVDEAGNTMTYYVCATTFYEADPEKVTGLHTDAIAAVFDVESAECVLEFDACGHPAAVYAWEDSYYACCTSTPEASGVLRYDPDILEEETVKKIIRSIFEKPE